jgi:hypothetical protein
MDAAIAHVNNSSGLLGQVLVVGNHNQGGAISVGSPKESQNVFTSGRIQLSSRLVSQKQHGLIGQSPSDGDSLHLPAGELGSSMPGSVRQAHVTEQLHGTRLSRPA